MANTVLTPTMITNEAVIVLENQCNGVRFFDSQYSDQFAKEGAKIGATLNVRKPPRYIGRQGSTLSVEDQTETQVPLVLTTQFGVDVQFNSQELTLSLQDFSKRVLMPQMAVIRNRIDRDCLLQAMVTPNEVGLPGTPPATLGALLAVRQRLLEMAAPDDGQIYLLLGPAANTSLVNGLSTLFNAPSKITQNYNEGIIADAGGLQIAIDQNVWTQTVGPLGGSPLVNGAGQALTTGWAYSQNLLTKGWTASGARLNAGDIFTIGSGATGVFSVNPQNRASTGVLQQFVVLAASASDGSGNSTVPILPAIISAGQYQNVSQSPADSATINVLGTASTQYVQNLGFHKSAYTIAFADLVLPKGVDMAERKVYKSISLRVVRAYDINGDRFPSRTDVLYGTRAIYPELGCRLTN
jgi:P22 coat protein - gene protein 5